MVDKTFDKRNQDEGDLVLCVLTENKYIGM